MQLARPLTRGALVLAAVTTLSASARAVSPAAEAAHDFYLSLLGDSGLELYSDERVFALYAAFNALGYDAAPVARENPIPRANFTGTRSQVRAAIQMSVALQKRFQDFFDAHPENRQAYLAYVLGLGPAPSFTAGDSVAQSNLKGLDKLLAAHEAEAHVAQVYLGLTQQLREQLKSLIAAADPVCRDADKYLPKATQATSLALNVLDDTSASAALGAAPADTIAIAGAPASSGKDADLSTLIAAYAAARALPDVVKSGAPSGVNELLGRVKGSRLPAGQYSPIAYVANAYGAAVAAQVLPSRRGAILADANARGLWLTYDLDKLLSEDKGRSSAEDVLGPKLAALDFKRVGPSALPNP